MIWVIVLIVVILLNIPFGYWRGNVQKFTWQWFLSVHLPVPVIMLLRIQLDLGWEWMTYPLLLGAYFLGQSLGTKWHLYWKRTNRVSNCLFNDIIRNRWIIIIYARR